MSLFEPFDPANEYRGPAVFLATDAEGRYRSNCIENAIRSDNAPMLQVVRGQRLARAGVPHVFQRNGAAILRLAQSHELRGAPAFAWVLT